MAEEMLAMPGNVVTGAMTDKLGRMIFGSGDQTLRTTVLGNPSGAFGSDPFGMDLRGVK